MRQYWGKECTKLHKRLGAVLWFPTQLILNTTINVSCPKYAHELLQERTRNWAKGQKYRIATKSVMFRFQYVGNKI